MGNVAKWNDACIVIGNIGIKLPNQEINVAHRIDGSGSTRVSPPVCRKSARSGSFVWTKAAASWETAWLLNVKRPVLRMH